MSTTAVAQLVGARVLQGELGHAYGKLGIRSRAQLPAALGREPVPAH